MRALPRSRPLLAASYGSFHILPQFHQIRRITTVKMAPDLLGVNEKRHKVTVVGSGNWGSTVAKIVAENTKEHSDLFEEEVQMWVFEEEVVIPKESPHYQPSIGEKLQKLTTIINTHHENVIYLPKIKLPSNIVANPSLVDAVQDSSILIFNLPHQFIDNVCKQLKGMIVPFARGISCIKGVHVSNEDVALFSEWIGDGLGIYCGALSGANVASGIAQEITCETNIAYDPPPVDNSRDPTPRSMTPNRNSPKGSVDLSITPMADMQHKDARGRTSKTKLVPVPPEYPPLDHDTFQTLFERHYFFVDMVSDVAGVSLGGALKNIVALAAGFAVGVGGDDNTKARVIRLGLAEEIKFAQEFFGDAVQKETFTDTSSGLGDLITSCSSGRNFRCAKIAAEEGIPVADVEARELNGQKLQGTSTAEEIHSFLKARGREKEYPLFTAVFDILEGSQSMRDIGKLIQVKRR